MRTKYIVERLILFVCFGMCFVPSESCEDKLTNCEAYDISVCRSPTYIRWAYENCAYFCGFCKYFNGAVRTTRTTTLATPSPTCMDKINYCSLYRHACKLDSYREWILRTCRKTCGFCEPKLPSTGMPLEGKAFG